MKLFKKKEIKNIIAIVAKERGMSISEVRQEYEDIIESHKNSSDPQVKAQFKKLFGNKTPTPEEFIITISKHS